MEQQIQLNDHNKQEYPPMHTCEHIVNRTMMNLFGCGRSVSAHIERKKSKLDYSLETAPTEEDVKRLEEAVNDVIAQGLDVTTEFITQEEAQGRFDLTARNWAGGTTTRWWAPTSPACSTRRRRNPRAFRPSPGVHLEQLAGGMA